MKKIIITVLILTTIPLFLAAQTAPTAVLEYFEDPYGEMIITDESGQILENFDLGEILPTGFSISTGGGIAEIRLNPNGTILKLAENTDFSITNLQGLKGSPSNEFTLLAGKLRTIAARTSGIDSYNLRTPTAVMGVRGTDFMSEVGQTVSNVVVREGLVEVIPFSGSSVMASVNQKVDTLAQVMQAVDLPLEQVNSLFRTMDFTALSPSDVPGHSPLPQGEKKAELPVKEKKTDVVNETEQLTETDMKEAQESNLPPSEVSRKNSPLVEVLRNIFGMEIGTTTIEGQTYSKVIVQPNIEIGKLKLGLYLPVIYMDNLFNPSDYYKPQKNNEWSFGTDQNGNTGDVVLDILKDTMLKIRYLEYGDQAWDSFYIKVGNLNNMSIGHGTIMNNYANDGDFPAIRKIGLNTGFSTGIFGMEFVSDNLAEPSIAGTRLFLNPISTYKAFEIGITGIADLFPARMTKSPSDYGDPWLLAFGMDLEFFEINRDNFKIKLFSDFSSMIPVFRETTNLDGIKVKSGVAPGLWIEDSTLKNFGIVAGLRGEVFRFTWSLEYRMSNGIYKPTLFNALYDRNKVEYLSDIIHYLDNHSKRGTVMGIYGEGGYILKDKFSFTMGYYWPWKISSDGDISFEGNDKFNISLIFMKGLIPTFPIHGSISYERSQLIETIKGKDGMTLLDANTVVSGELVYPLAPSLDIVFGASTAIETDINGNLIMREGTNTPKISPVINIETRIHF